MLASARVEGEEEEELLPHSLLLTGVIFTSERWEKVATTLRGRKEGGREGGSGIKHKHGHKTHSLHTQYPYKLAVFENKAWSQEQATHISRGGDQLGDGLISTPPALSSLPDDVVRRRMVGSFSLGAPHLV